MRYAVLLLSILAFPTVSAQPVTFVPLPDHPISQTYHAAAGAFWADYDGDGDPDLLIGNHLAPDELWVNTLDGFVLHERNLSAYGSMVDAAWIDLDADGDLDLPVASLERNSLFANVGEGELVYSFDPVIEAYTNTRALDIADVNGDGRLDLFYSRRYGLLNPLLLNTPGGFTPAGGDINLDANDSSSSCWGDFDLDGDSDLYVGNANEGNDFYRNDEGVLRRMTEGPLLTGATTTIACAWADVDNDGDLDLYLLNTGSTPNVLFVNESGIFVEDQSAEINVPGADSRNGQWADVDNDGDLDLLVVNRFQPATLYENKGEDGYETFLIDPDYTSSVWAENGALFDHDGDGDLDLLIVTGNSDEPAFNRLYESQLDGSAAWLEVQLEGVFSNHNGIGARIEAFATIQGVPVRQLREMRVLPARRTQTAFRAHFGFGDASVVDSLVINWPSGIRQVLYDVPVNALHTIEEPPTSTRTTTTGPYDRSLHVDVTPNPAEHSSTVTLRGAERGTVTLEVFDALGRRLLREERTTPSTFTLSWHEMGVPSGTYVVRVAQGTEQRTRVITVHR